MTLSWNPPVNIQTADELSEYQIRFKPDGNGRYHEMTVKDSCTASIDFTHESGLLPSKNYNFEVRARNDSGEGTWVKASAICGMLFLYIQAKLPVNLGLDGHHLRQSCSVIAPSACCSSPWCHGQGRRNRSGRPGNCRTNVLTNQGILALSVLGKVCLRVQRVWRTLSGCLLSTMVNNKLV